MTTSTQTPLEWFMDMVGPSSEGLYQIPFKTTAHNIKDYVKITEEGYKALYEKFTSCDTVPQLLGGSKIYIHGKTSLTNDRWSNLFKKNGWSRTYDISDASLILINKEDCFKPDSRCSFYNTISGLLICNAAQMMYVKPEYVTEYNRQHPNTAITVSHDRVIVARYGVTQPYISNNFSGLYDSFVGSNYFISMDAIEMFHAHMNKNVTIIDEKLMAKLSGNNVIIDEDSFVSLRDMLKSSDQENHTVARKILYECDIDNSLYYIWKLAKSGCFWNMHENRTKLGREFVGKTKLYQLHNMSAKKFLAEVESRKLLTKEIFTNLRQELIEDVEHNLKRVGVHNLVDINFKFNDTYSQYVDSNEPTIITNNKKDDEDDE